MRFLSVEPLLGPMTLARHLTIDMRDLHSPVQTNIHWVIVGGESGPSARPMYPEWVTTLRAQCVAAAVFLE